VGMGAVTDPEISVSGVNYINTQEKKDFFSNKINEIYFCSYRKIV
jgi:hypothetical protein